MTTRAAAEEHLDAIVFVPPKASKEDYALFQALSVGHNNGTSTAKFTTIRMGISEDFLQSFLPLKVPEFNNYLASVPEHMDSFDDILHVGEARSGSLGAKAAQLFHVGGRFAKRSQAGYTMHLTELKAKKIELRISTSIALLMACVLPFCEDSGAIMEVFDRREPTRFSGSIDYGLAFVTTCITGKVHIQEGTASRTVASTNASAEGVEASAMAAVESSEEGEQLGGGVVGVAVYFFHLYKSKNSMNDAHQGIRIRDHFGIQSADDTRLKDLLGSWAGRIRRKYIGPRKPPSIGLALAEDYHMGVSFSGDIDSLIQLADEQGLESTQSLGDAPEGEAAATLISSLRLVGGESGDQKVPADEPFPRRYTRSNNVLHEGTLVEFERIHNEIRVDGFSIVRGRKVDAIKPAVKVEISDSLPILYRAEHSGIPSSGGSVPGWVLRAVPGGKLFMLWGVTGLDGDDSMHPGIVSAYDETDWHVRECIEFVDKDDTALIEELKGEGFLPMDPSEADPVELPLKVDIAMVTDGRYVMMGLHLLALKNFHLEEEDSEEEGEDGAVFCQGVAEGSAVSSASLPGTSYGAIPPTVTNYSTTDSPQRKKPRGDQKSDD